MSFENKFLKVLGLLNVLFVVSGAVGSAGTLAINRGTTVCGVSSGTLNTVYCANISESASASPYQILSTVQFDSVSGGTNLFCGLKSGGAAFFCWNGSGGVKRLYNGSGVLSELNVGETQISAVNLAGNQILWWRGDQNFPLSKSGRYNSVTSGRNFTCGITTNHTVKCWGPQGSVMQDDFANQSMSTIISGDSHVCGLDTSGFLVCKGSNTSGQSSVPTGTAFEYTSLALGSSHTCALKQPNNTVTCWGGTDGSPAGTGTYTPANNTEFELLVASGNLTCGLTTANYTTSCWDSNWRNVSVFKPSLPPILPGICVKNDSSCTCGTQPGSASLCSGTRVICQVCTSDTTGTAPPPPTALPPSSTSKKKDSIGWKIFAIIGTVGTFFGLCAIIYCLYAILRRKKVHNSVLPQITPGTGTDINNNKSNSSPNGLSISRGNGGTKFSRSSSVPRVFIRQRSHTLNRQRSGPSSFKDRAEEFTFEQLEKATNFFSLDAKLGAGSFGTVYRARLSDGREVAIKRGDSSPKNRKKQEKESAFQSELGFLSRLHHKHLASLVGFCVEKDERLLVYEYMKNGALYDHLHPKDPNFDSPVLSSWKMRIKLLLDASRGIEYLHNYAVPPIIHRDIKSSNILLDANWVARVSDFGLSLMGPETQEGFVSMKAAGTVGYMDPEYFGMQHLTVKSDVYSFGVVMLEVITGKKAIFRGEGEPVSIVEYAVPRIEMGEINLILDGRVRVVESSEMEAVELVGYVAMHCVKEGRERPVMADVVANLETALALFEGSRFSGSSKSLNSVGSLDARE